MGPGPDPASVSIAVVGAGPGGLSAALALLSAGFDVHVYEQAPALAEVGAGVQVTPNAARVLHGLGLADALGRVAVRAEAWQQRRWDDGRIVLRTPLGESVERRFGFPHYQMRRADLVSVLTAALPPARLHLDHRLVALEDRGADVRLEFADGIQVAADLVVGADGIHSAVRRAVFGELAPRFTGCAAFRGLVPAERVRGVTLDPTAQIWMGPGRHVAHYFVSGRRLVNFVAVVDQDQWTRESWSARADPADALAEFDGWHPQVRAILGAVENLYVLALFDREPMARWSAGRVTLLGDACHAMLPFMAQSAAQAIEDGATLAACLRAGSDLPGALGEYERARIPRTARLQAMSADNKTRFHLPDGPAQRLRDAEMAGGTTDWSFDPIAWVYDHDASQFA